MSPDVAFLCIPRGELSAPCLNPVISLCQISSPPLLPVHGKHCSNSYLPFRHHESLLSTGSFPSAWECWNKNDSSSKFSLDLSFRPPYPLSCLPLLIIAPLQSLLLDHPLVPWPLNCQRSTRLGHWSSHLLLSLPWYSHLILQL